MLNWLMLATQKGSYISKWDRVSIPNCQKHLYIEKNNSKQQNKGITDGMEDI